MTASQRVAVAQSEGGQGQGWANALSLEWFSDTDGRVVIESASCLLKLGEAAWRMGADEESDLICGAETVRAAHQLPLDFLGVAAPLPAPVADPISETSKAEHPLVERLRGVVERLDFALSSPSVPENAATCARALRDPAGRALAGLKLGLSANPHSTSSPLGIAAGTIAQALHALGDALAVCQRSRTSSLTPMVAQWFEWAEGEITTIRGVTQKLMDEIRRQI
jgi:hypothetical protein